MPSPKAHRVTMDNSETTQLNADAGQFSTVDECFEVEGRHLCRASIVDLSRTHMNGQLPDVLLAFSRGRTGLFMRFTPEGARMLAGNLIATANRAEADGAAEVARMMGGEAP